MWPPWTAVGEKRMGTRQGHLMKHLAGLNSHRRHGPSVLSLKTPHPFVHLGRAHHPHLKYCTHHCHRIAPTLPHLQGGGGGAVRTRLQSQSTMLESPHTPQMDE